MWWPWKADKGNAEAANSAIAHPTQNDALSNISPDLKQFYFEAKPPTPISLVQPASKATDTSTPKDKSVPSVNTSTGNDDTDRSIIQTAVQGVPDVPQLYGREERPRRISLQQAARDNCVEFEMALSRCLVQGTLWNRFLSCYDEKMSQSKCNDLQEFALAALGYSPDLDEPLRKSIVNKADDLMIQTIPTTHISAETADAYKAAVSRAKQSAEQEGTIYRTY